MFVLGLKEDERVRILKMRLLGETRSEDAPGLNLGAPWVSRVIRVARSTYRAMAQMLTYAE